LTRTRARFEAPASEPPARLDLFLTARLPEWTRSALRKQIDAGAVRVNGRPARKAGAAVDPGDVVDIELPELADPAAGPVAQTIPLVVLFEDHDLVVVDKPAGLVVHPGHGRDDGTLVNALLGRGTALAPAGGRARPGIVHRLDRETSGVMVVAKTDSAHRALAAAFASREVRKTYHALVWGHPAPPDGTIDRRIARSRTDRTKMSTGLSGGRTAVTRYRTVETLPGFALLEIDLETGRTHQIRVHMQAIGHPVVGDERYGGRMWRSLRDPRRRNAVRDLGRNALHASTLAFTHPRTGTAVSFESPLPRELDALLAVLREPV